MSQHTIQKKVCMLGMFGVGKTSLVKRFVYDRFDEDVYLSTIGVKVYQKLLPPIQLPSRKIRQYSFLIWDIEGSEENSQPVRNYFIGAAGAFIVADLTRKDTIEKVPVLVDFFHAIAPGAKLVLAANKADLVKKDAVTLTLFKKVAADLGLDYFVTSAMSGDHVEDAFTRIGEQIAGEE